MGKPAKKKTSARVRVVKEQPIQAAIQSTPPIAVPQDYAPEHWHLPLWIMFFCVFAFVGTALGFYISQYAAMIY
jgi:hypothetical protein